MTPINKISNSIDEAGAKDRLLVVESGNCQAWSPCVAKAKMYLNHR